MHEDFSGKFPDFKYAGNTRSARLSWTDKAILKRFDRMAFSRNIIQHALNLGEKRVGSYFLDGYAEIGNVMYGFEYFGCLFHGCPSCFNPLSICPLRGASYEEIFSATLQRKQILESLHGLKLEVIWEHDWEEKKRNCAAVKEFIQNS